MSAQTQTSTITISCGGGEVIFTTLVHCDGNGNLTATLSSNGLETDDSKHVGGRPKGR